MVTPPPPFFFQPLEAAPPPPPLNACGGFFFPSYTKQGPLLPLFPPLVLDRFTESFSLLNSPNPFFPPHVYLTLALCLFCGEGGLFVDLGGCFPSLRLLGFSPPGRPGAWRSRSFVLGALFLDSREPPHSLVVGSTVFLRGGGGWVSVFPSRHPSPCKCPSPPFFFLHLGCLTVSFSFSTPKVLTLYFLRANVRRHFLHPPPPINREVRVSLYNAGALFFLEVKPFSSPGLTPPSPFSQLALSFARSCPVSPPHVFIPAVFPCPPS